MYVISRCGSGGYDDGVWIEEILSASKGRPYKYKLSWGLSTQVETTLVIYQFILEEIVFRYGCVGKIGANRGGLNFNKV